MNRPLMKACIGFALMLTAYGSPAAAQSPAVHENMPVYYLSLGTSLAAGVQADEDGNSIVTDVSYPGQLAGIIGEDIRKLRHVNMGCPGEDSDTFIDGGICEYRQGSQLDQAVHFLHAHGKFTGLITIDLGANDVLRCIQETQQGTMIDLECFIEAIDRLAANLTIVLSTLREAAGPDVPVVGMNYYNPLLAFWFDDPVMAAQTAVLQAQINQVLENVYAQFGIPVADVAGAFGTDDLITDENQNGTPDSVETLCAWTWMCSRQNIHPNEAGYQVIAEEFAAILPPIIPAKTIHQNYKP